MSFRCQYCNQAQETYETPLKIVVETREVPKKNRDGMISDGMRREIVREVSICSACAGQKHASDPEVIRRAVFREARERARIREMTTGVVSAEDAQ